MADGRPIPGFFYDEEQKKYFKIQANQYAPTGSKFSADRVKEQQEKSRKRKRHERYTAKLATETIRPSQVLSASHAKSTFGRELGVQHHSCSAKTRSTAIIDRLRVQTDFTVCACYSCGSRHYVYDFVPLERKRAVIVGVGDARSGLIERRSLGRRASERMAITLTGLSSQLTAVNINSSGTLMATSTACTGANVALTKIPDTTDNDDLNVPSMLMTLGGDVEEDYVITSSMNPGSSLEQGIVLTEGTYGGRAYQLDLYQGIVAHRATVTRSKVRSVDWLNERTAVIGDNEGCITLWDVRTSGTSKRQTDLQSLWQVRAENDCSIWAASAEGLSLYDVRMSRRKEKSNHGGDQQAGHRWTAAGRSQKPGRAKMYGNYNPTPISTPTSDCVLHVQTSLKIATVMEVWKETSTIVLRGDDNQIMLHSTLDGSLVKTLPPPPPRMSDCHWIRRFRTTEDEKGRPSLMYSIGHHVRSWTYGVGEKNDHGGREEEEMEEEVEEVVEEVIEDIIEEVED